LLTDWSKRIGHQRDWVWRGWQTRYSYMRSQQHDSSKPPLILIHGFGASIEHWRNNIPVLSRDRTVYALDLLGFGASRKADTPYSVALWVQQVYDFWQTFIRQPVVLVGNSIGSLVCMTAAATYPDMVEGIVMLSLPDVSIRQAALPKWLLPIVTGLENAIASPPLLKTIFKVVRRPSIVRRWVGVAYIERSAVTDELIDILSAPAQDDGAAQTFCNLFKSVRLPEFSPSATAILPKLEIPMLLVWGRQDCMVPFAIAPILASLNPKIKFVELENAGHCPHDEYPDKFNAILLEWLDIHFKRAIDVESLKLERIQNIIEEAS
jgi:pimeloyl-ACP methyl ester carboxylesterase